MPHLTVVPPTSGTADTILRGYFTELVSRYWGRPATAAEISRAMADEPSDDLTPPSGVLIVALEGDQPVGCGGVRFPSDGIAELTRMYVAAGYRRSGLATVIVRELEARARAVRCAFMRLDTRTDLVEARALYERLGYVEVPAFNRDPYAEHWYEKHL